VKTKAISSTDAQNNFGRVMESAIQEHTAYVVRRRNVAQVVIIGLEDFQNLLRDASDREKMGGVLREVSPEYELGEDLGGGRG
jgi:prevent-host-death family protein